MVSATFTKPIKLEFEKVYCPYLLMNKKQGPPELFKKIAVHRLFGAWIQGAMLDSIGPGPSSMTNWMPRALKRYDATIVSAFVLSSDGHFVPQFKPYISLSRGGLVRQLVDISLRTILIDKSVPKVASLADALDGSSTNQAWRTWEVAVWQFQFFGRFSEAIEFVQKAALPLALTQNVCEAKINQAFCEDFKDSSVHEVSDLLQNKIDLSLLVITKHPRHASNIFSFDIWTQTHAHMQTTYTVQVTWQRCPCGGLCSKAGPCGAGRAHAEASHLGTSLYWFKKKHLPSSTPAMTAMSVSYFLVAVPYVFPYEMLPFFAKA